MNPEDIRRIRELVAAGKGRDEIEAELASSGLNPADLNDMLDILNVSSPASSAQIPAPPPSPSLPVPNPIQAAPPPMPPPNPVVSPAVSPALSEQYGASGSEAAYAEEVKGSGRRFAKRVLKSVGIIFGVIVLVIAGSVVYALARVNGGSSADVATITRLGSQPAAAAQTLTTPCFTVAISTSLASKAKTLCGVSGQQSSPLEVVLVQEQQSDQGGQTTEQFAKRFTQALKETQLIAALRGSSCLIHGALVAPTVERSYSTCSTKDGKELSSVSYSVFSSNTVVSVLGISDTMADNPAPAAYASLKVTAP
jgi:hypothetical protein